MTDQPKTEGFGSDVTKVEHDVEREAHPIVKQLWQHVEGDFEKAKAWLEKEWGKI